MNRSKVAIGLACLTIAGVLFLPACLHAGQYDLSASVRVHVEPRQTEVFINGYYAGIADDFDGFFQRLRLEPGEHDVELYLSGHRNLRQKIYLQPGGSFRIRHTMVPVQAGETPDARPTPPASTLTGPSPDPYGRSRDERGRPDRPEPPRRREPRAASDSAFGTLAIRVQPGDADVIIDGDRWQGPDTERLLIQLPAGEHRIEVRKSGFATFTSTVQIRRGETTTLNVSLAKN